MTLPDVEFPIAMDQGFDGLYGLVIDGIDDDGALRAHVDVQEHHKQPAGLVHGGLLAAIAEAITSMGTYDAVMGEGKSAQGLSNQTSFLRPVLGSRIDAVARPRHRGRTTWVWEVDHLDGEERVVALSRVTIAVRER